ncbi:MAG: MFS transporter [Armatimonadota bacterium]
MSESPQAAPRLTTTQWLICVVAAIGFAFDIYELLMLPLIVRPALMDLGGIQPGSAEFNRWVGMLFYVPALFGGVFGLLGGYLTDRFGRRQVLVWSILLYAFSAMAAGFATSIPMLLFFRTTTFIGVCVEFVAAVAWIAELFPHGRQREAVLGWTQAASSLGGVMVTAAYGLAVLYADSLPAIHGDHQAWRYTLISGVIPALPLMIIRPFLPESPAWAAKKAAGTLRRPSIGELFQPAFRRTTIVTTILMACSYGAAFGAIQHIPRIVPGLPQVLDQNRAIMRAEMTELQQLPPEARPAAMRQLGEAARMPPPQQPDAVRAIPQLAALPAEQVDAIIGKLPKVGAEVREKTETNVASVQFAQEMGGLVGRMILAALAVLIASRGNLLRLFQIPGLILIPLVFYFPGRDNLSLFTIGAALAGVLTVAQFSFWGNYLPRVYPTHLRGTGESFAANIGGRMLGTSAALVTTQLANVVPGNTAPEKLAVAAAIVAFSVYAIGLVTSFWLPEPKAEELPE